MKDGINVLSLFDGMSCGRIALEKNNILVNKYFASEIDKYAISVSKANYSDIKHVWDVTKVSYSKDQKGINWLYWEPNKELLKDTMWETKIDLLIWGSPCQGFSFAGKQLNFEDPRSKLFFEFVRLLKETKPKYFLLENVYMKKEYQNIISEELGVQPIEINSRLVSAQNRKRLYWTNIPNIKIPTDKNIHPKEILEENVEEKYFYSDQVLSRLDLTDIKNTGMAWYKAKWKEVDKIGALLARHYKGMQSLAYPVIKDQGKYRKLTPIECERLQTVPDNYTSNVSNTQRYKMLGNGWTVDVIAHIFSFMNFEKWQK